MAGFTPLIDIKLPAQGLGRSHCTPSMVLFFVFCFYVLKDQESKAFLVSMEHL